MVKRRVRDALAASFRRLPRFRGKARLGALLGQWLTDYPNDEDCHVSFHLVDGSRVWADLRSEVGAYWTGEYDHFLVQRLARCLKNGDVAVDVGANVGLWSVQLGQRLRALGGGQVYAFEPVPGNFTKLQEVIQINRLQEIITPLPLALGHEDSTCKLRTTDPERTTGNAMVVQERTEGVLASDFTTRLARLSDVAQEVRIASCALIKIDIEGAELLFLEGAQAFIRKHRPIIFGEFCAAHLQRFGSSFADVFRTVAPWDYHFYRFVNPNRFARVLAPGVGLEHMLLVPAETSKELLSQIGVVSRDG